MYLSYSEYVLFGGTLSESDFNNISYDVEATIDFYTSYRLTKDTEFSDKVKKCEYKLIQLQNNFDNYQKNISNMSSPVISNQSNDGVSVSYGGYVGNTTPSDVRQLQNNLNKDIYNTIRKYLINERNQSNASLLYRGGSNV